VDALYAYLDAAAFGRELARIIYQIPNYLLQSGRITRNRCHVRVEQSL
jgi:hypothetical protein